MTFEPAKLGSLGASLDAEVKSANILLRRLDALSSKAGGDERGEKEGESGEMVDGSEGKRDEGVEKAREALAAYKSWLSDPSGEFNFAKEDTEEGDVRLVVPLLVLR
ncbi:hypothetical protein IMZ48_16845 [Candidatus Bathyarchaeota archaeon]|nr:hypothetical protein [Candidatus Bathyarchaeota archaeon]